jgi:chromosome segregation ATPase
MQLRKFLQDVRDIHFQSVGLATRTGLDTALQRQHKLRKEMRVNRREMLEFQEQLNQLQENTTSNAIAELKKEIASLKKEVASLKKAKKG